MKKNSVLRVLGLKDASKFDLFQKGLKKTLKKELYSFFAVDRCKFVPLNHFSIPYQLFYILLTRIIPGSVAGNPVKRVDQGGFGTS